ncbi:MAG: hypothetical protein K6E95_06980 [Lachnospiraceae bacterium]|nr:hypothetical protein [Lachnospiraceae bacterium]
MEKDLFKPIKKYFEGQGFECDGEVDGIDLYMEKDGQAVAVELKVTLDFRVVMQAALRQKLVPYVYIGTFAVKNTRSPLFRDKLYLLKRLGIGLILVTKSSKAISVMCEPAEADIRDTSTIVRKRKHLKREFSERRTRLNTGGVNKQKLITSYREDALLVLNALAELGGEGSPADVRTQCGVERAYNILYKNHYGWFKRVGTGRYNVTDKGYAALEEFEDVLYTMLKNKPDGRTGK